MKRIAPVATALAFPLTLISQAALADLTPAQVWGDWRSYLEGMGYAIDASESTRGGTLSVDGLVLRFAVPQDQGSMEMGIGSIDFVQNSDGSVAVVLPDNMPFTFEGLDSETGEPFTMRLSIAQTDHAMTASGAPEEITYLYTAGTIALGVDEAIVDGETFGPDQLRVSFTGNSLRSTTTMSIGDTRAYDQTGSLQSLSYEVFARDPEVQGTVADVSGTVNGVTIAGTGTIPLEMGGSSDMAAMIRAGFDVNGTIGYAGGASRFDIQDVEDGNFQMETSSGGGSLGVEIGADGLAYDVRQKDVNAGVTVEGMPFPFQIAMAESGFRLAVPVIPSDDPQDFALRLNLGNFTMSDMIWSMFDPAGQLPRDPATVLLDLGGKVKLLVDWMNPDAASQLAGQPGEVQAVTLRSLLVNAVGARLEGEGAVTLDGAGAQMVPGVGTPVGEVNFNLSGANQLIDTLIAMGLLPEDQAMGARMMMGLFAVPGDGPDTLRSKIEFTPEGQILANGQRIR